MNQYFAATSQAESAFRYSQRNPKKDKTKQAKPADPYANVDNLYDPLGRGYLPVEKDSPDMPRLNAEDLHYAYFDDPEEDDGLFLHEVKAQIKSPSGQTRDLGEVNFYFDPEEGAVSVGMVWVEPKYRRFGLSRILLDKMRERVTKLYPHAKILFSDVHTKEMLRSHRGYMQSIGAADPHEIDAAHGYEDVDALPASKSGAYDWAEQYLPPVSGVFDNEGEFVLPSHMRKHVQFTRQFPHYTPPNLPPLSPADASEVNDNPAQLKLFADRMRRWRRIARAFDAERMHRSASFVDNQIRRKVATQWDQRNVVSQWGGPNNLNVPMSNRVIPWKEMASEHEEQDRTRQRNPRYRVPDQTLPSDLPKTKEEENNLFNMHGEGDEASGFAYVDPWASEDGGASKEEPANRAQPYGKYRPH